MKTTMLSLLLAAFASAQSRVCVTGVVQTVGPTICMQGETHVLDGTQVFLRSNLLNLNQYVGQLVRLEGADIGLLCHVLEVSAVSPARAILQSCGTPMPGCSLKLKVGPGAIGRYALLASFGAGYAPLGCAPPDWLDGTVLLAQPAYTLVIAMFPGPFGEYVWPIPNNPSLQGVRVWFQGARQDIGPMGPVELTNSLRVQISPFMPPCGSINC